MSEPTAQAADVTESDSQRPPREDAHAPRSAPVLVEQDLLVEDISIDGMCGVY